MRYVLIRFSERVPRAVDMGHQLNLYCSRMKIIFIFMNSTIIIIMATMMTMVAMCCSNNERAEKTLFKYFDSHDLLVKLAISQIISVSQNSILLPYTSL